MAVAGVPSQPNTYYFGAVGGGVWKTTDRGATWAPVSDGLFKTASVGAMAVADSDPNVDLRGHGRSLRARQCLERRRRLQVPRWRQDLAPHGPRPDLSHRRGAGASEESRHRVRGRAGTPVGAERRARRLPLHRRRRDLEAGTHPRAGCGRGGPRDGSRQPARALRQLLAGAAQPVPFRQRRPGQRALEIHRRRRQLDGHLAGSGTAERRAGAHRRDRFAGESGARVGPGGSGRRRRVPLR